jgi:GT2 family glycosyltransferase
MQTDRLAAKPSVEPDDELYRLIVAYQAAREAGNKSLAMRYIDRAKRIAPDRPEINYLYAQVFVDEAPGAALPFLKKAAEAQSSAHFESAVISALVANDEYEGAVERLEAALRRFAVAPGGPLAKLARRITAELAPRWPGWVGIAPDLRLCGEILAIDESARLSVHDPLTATESDYLISPDSESVGQFQVKAARNLPRRTIAFRALGRALMGGEVAFPPDFNLDGRATLIADRITGWVSIGWAVINTPKILVTGRNGFRMRIASEPDLLDAGLHRFSIDRELCSAGGDRLIFSVMLPDGRYARLPDTPLLIEPPKPPAARPGRRILRAGSPETVDRTVDVIIPVYKGVDETLNCIHSVIATVEDAEVIVIDDASPEPGMAFALDDLAASGKITLLRNRRNVGFPRTVNRGFALHPTRDVIVLNSDTEVYGDWLERLRIAAYSGTDIGAVTPLTNSGSIASYPKSEDDCSREDALDRDRLATTVNDSAYLDIPTGVGFCLYLRRECLAQVGYFDTATFARGYGEENDLCLRAGRLGWRSTLAPNVFVRHLGGRSFGTRRKPLFERNNRLINLRYPGYDENIQDFLSADPAHDARRRLDEEFLTRAGRNHVLLVTLALEGGVRRAVNERAAFWREKGFAAISLKPDPGRSDRCVLSVDGAVYDDLTYQLPGEIPKLIDLLARLSIESVELHHFLGLPPDLIEQLFRLGAPVDIWVHDYVWYCPRITLIGTGDVYCGEPEVSACEACIAQNGSVLGEEISVAELRDRSARWLSEARTVLAPSLDLVRRLRAKFPGIDPRIRPLEDAVAPRRASHRPAQVLKIAVIGAIGVQKGYNILLAAANDAAERDLPIEFVVIGYTKDDNALLRSGKVFITGQYDESEVEELIAREAPAAALFVSVFPETWCYALTHAVKAGLSIAAFDFGAIAERLRDGGGSGILFPLSASAQELNDGLLKAFPVLPKPEPVVPALSPRGKQGMPTPRGNDDFTDEDLPARGRGSRDGMVQNLNQLTASVEVLPLMKGLYLFSVGATDSRRVGDDHELILPALQVGLGPGTPLDSVEIMFGPRTDGPWLCEPRDHIVVKVKATSTILLLTSIRAQGMAALEIDVKRLDGPQAARPGAAQPAKPADPPANATPRQPLALPAQRKPPVDPSADNGGQSIPLRITVHVQRRGDMVFNDNQWAGVGGQRLAVESFSIQPLSELTPDLIEYKAVTASGVETPWITGGALCGSRGMGMPLVGFAVRLKAQAQAARDYICEYSAVMVSGAILGPVRDGAPCRSVDIGDPIEAIWVSIKKVDAGQKMLDRPKAQPSVAKSPKQKSVPAEEPVLAAAPPSAPEPPKARPPIGPRFSVFRDPVE